MPRTPRKPHWTEEACYHVISRGHNREQVLGDDDDCQHFLHLWSLNRGRMPGRGDDAIQTGWSGRLTLVWRAIGYENRR
jgi:hypothetical protein